MNDSLYKRIERRALCCYAFVAATFKVLLAVPPQHGLIINRTCTEEEYRQFFRTERGRKRFEQDNDVRELPDGSYVINSLKNGLHLEDDHTSPAISSLAQ